MPKLAALALAPLLLAVPALAQQPPVNAQTSAEARHETPVDKGPDTPQANAAFNGGGVILQGAPGAPAPAPQALPAAPSGTPAPR